MQRIQSFVERCATLYVIATPIGNLNEISPRIEQTLKEVEAVFCEDTRVSCKILNYLGIKKSLYSAYENKENEAATQILSFLNQQQSIALMSDAGYPGISDPGQKIIQKVIAANYPVVVINGPSAVIQSVVASGMDTDHFYFYGFLDPRSAKRKKELQSLSNFEHTMVFYQSPHKLKETLQDLLEIFDNRKICLCRELTKKFEEFIRGTIQEVFEIADTLKGEMVLVVEGKKKDKNVIDVSLIDEINDKIQNGFSKNEAIKTVAKEYNVSKNELYHFYHKGGSIHE